MRKIKYNHKHCIACGKEMINEGPARVSQKVWANKKYCSRKCRRTESQPGYVESKICPTCGIIFRRKKNHRGILWTDKVYCSSKCCNSRKERKRVMQNCVICGKSYNPRGVIANSKTCSHICAGKLHSKNTMGARHNLWNGGRVKTRQGYIRIWISEDHQLASMKPKGSNHILEHRLVMAEILGRPLFDWETVHHKNGKKDDNRKENLELRTGHHGQGATHHCQTCTCGQRLELTENPIFQIWSKAV
ncbi:MAG TPA: HNH endonuclease [Puia sp.]|jgi:hypothetical protein|nr:HNH endonuclease [Puia sp.]